jgi:uncharacterized protein YneF (UPF0154 family)
MEENQNKKNKSSLYIVIAIVVVIILILLASKSKKEIPENPPMTENDIELNNALASDSTTQIQDSLNKIDVTDTTAKDLEDVDKDLNNL